MTVKNNRIALKKIKAKFSSRVLTDANSLKNASYDNLRISYLPEAVIIIKTAEEVGDVLKIAYKYNIPIVARGAGSSTTGSAVPLQKGWVIDLKKLNKIKINLISKVASVGVGVVTSNLQKKAEENGLFYPPDPSSKNYSTIGGNIACNAGGLRCLKYGVTRDYVFGLEGYLANGDFVKWSLPLKKDVSGLNLRDLWIGSEGLLGIITKAHLKLIPFPKKRWLSVMAFKNERIAINSIHKIFKNRMNPSLCEFLDQQTVICAEKYLDKPIFKNSPGSSLVIIEFDGNNEEVNQSKKQLLSLLSKEILDFKESNTIKGMENILDIRRNCSHAMFAMGDTKLNEDIVVPIEKLYEILKFTKYLKKEISLPTPTFGHAGDGNLHVHIMYNRAINKDCMQAKKGIKLLMKKVIELGGSITGEHGVGISRSSYLKLQHSNIEIKLMKKIKNVFDEKGILNPGKMFKPFDIWKEDKVVGKMPWEN